jgi:alkylation response protein AidB-like acyl-CoA dehydrogenase
MQRFAFTDEHAEFRSSLRGFLADHAAGRRVMDTRPGEDPTVWKRISDELGLSALIVPERFGGAGFTAVELAIVLEETGRVLSGAPLLSTVGLAANTLLAAADESASGEYLPRIADGTLTATVSFPGLGDSGDLSARAYGTSSWLLSGRRGFVLDGTTAGLVLAFAHTVDGIGLFAVNGDAEGLGREVVPTVDLTRQYAALEFRDTPACLVGSLAGGRDVLDRSLDAAVVALAAEQVGGAQAALDLSVDYARNRVQFGRPIGSFQAIKHLCADMLLDVELARSLAYGTAWAMADNDGRVSHVAPLVKAFCSEMFVRVATSTIQVHGGIGFTWEHDAHLFFRRARAAEQFLGHPSAHREAYAARIGL